MGETLEPEPQPAADAHTESVEAAYARYRAELQQFGQARLRNRQSARDLVQEVFLQLVRFPPAQALRDAQAYLYRIAWHIVNRENRKLAENRVSYHDTRTVAAVAESQASVEDTLDTVAFQQQFRRVLSELPSEVQAALLLFKRDGLSHKEIARRLGISPNTVKAYISRGVAHFKNADWNT